MIDVAAIINECINVFAENGVHPESDMAGDLRQRLKGMFAADPAREHLMAENNMLSRRIVYMIEALDRVIVERDRLKAHPIAAIGDVVECDVSDLINLGGRHRKCGYAETYDDGRHFTDYGDDYVTTVSTFKKIGPGKWLRIE